MRIDIMEIKPKNNKIKLIIIALLAILFIVFSSILGIHYAKIYNAKMLASKKQNVDVSKKQSDTVNNIGDSGSFLPKYSENAKNRLNNIYSKESKIAYLTFDDGPSQAVTPLTLDLLKQENIKATFFVLGSNVKKNPDIVKRAYLEGHYIANHGYTHKYSKLYEKPANVLAEYNKTEKEIQKAIENNKYYSHLFRFPGGFEGGRYEKVKKEAAKLLDKKNILYIDWNVLTGDAEGANTKEKILKNIKKYTKDKGNIVILMHDSSSKILTYETLKDVIDYLRNQGYTFDNFYNIMS